MAQDGDESCPNYLPEEFRINLRLQGKADHFGPLEFSDRADPRVQAGEE